MPTLQYLYFTILYKEVMYKILLHDILVTALYVKLSKSQSVLLCNEVIKLTSLSIVERLKLVMVDIIMWYLFDRRF